MSFFYLSYLLNEKILNSRRSDNNEYFEFETLWNDGSRSWEPARTFFDGNQNNFIGVYQDFLSKNATSDVEREFGVHARAEAS